MWENLQVYSSLTTVDKLCNEWLKNWGFVPRLRQEIYIWLLRKIPVVSEKHAAS
jgi:hypothetical protein